MTGTRVVLVLPCCRAEYGTTALWMPPEGDCSSPLDGYWTAKDGLPHRCASCGAPLDTVETIRNLADQLQQSADYPPEERRARELDWSAFTAARYNNERVR